MNILHIIPTMAPRYGGPVSALSGLAKAQAAIGHSVTIATTNRDYPKGELRPLGPRLLQGSDVEIRYFSCEMVPYLFSYGLACFLRSHIRDFDIVHIWTLYRYPTAIASHLARRYNIPHVLRPCGALEPPLRKTSAIGPRLKLLYEWGIEWGNLKGASAINAVTTTEAANLPSFIPREKTFTLGNGVDWDLYEALPARGTFRANHGLGDGPLVLFLGRISFVKGLDLLIPAFDTLSREIPDVKLAIVGPENDDYGQKVRGWIAERRLNDKIHFVAHLEGEAVLQSYVDADVFVLPSYTENFGMSVVEAMACGTPVVISDQVNIHTEVSRAGAGLITRCDASEVSKGLTDLFQDASRRKTMGAAGRRLVKASFTWQTIVNRLSAEYELVIARTHGQKRIDRTARARV